MEPKIKHIDFVGSMIYTTTTDGQKYYRSLDEFPLLKKASPTERMQYRIGKFGDDVRWETLDEDIHISSLTKQKL